MKVQKGFTLMEMVVAVIIIGILASLAIANYARTVERTLDKEAFSSLKMLRVAEKSYYMDWRMYYDSSSTGMTEINDKLKVFLVTGSKRNWNYTVKLSGCSQATRYNDPARNWKLIIDNDGDPVEGTCP